MSTPKPLRVAVIGPAGFGGSYLCVELISRGHHVVGLSRNPEKLGSHANYEPRPVDIDNNTDSQLAEAMRDVDVVVSEYGPHTAGHQALQYGEPPLETVSVVVTDHDSSFYRSRSKDHLGRQEGQGWLLCHGRRCRKPPHCS